MGTQLCLDILTGSPNPNIIPPPTPHLIPLREAFAYMPFINLANLNKEYSFYFLKLFLTVILHMKDVFILLHFLILFQVCQNLQCAY